MKKKRKRAKTSKRVKRVTHAKRAERKKSAVPDSEINRNPEFAAVVGRALLRAAESARCIARMYGTPIYVWEKGRVVAKRP